MSDEGTATETEHSSSPASRGAAGAYIEGELGALYLLALLTGNRAPGLPDARVVSVRFQGVEQGFELDDLIIKGVGVAGDAILEIQSKRDITFSPGDTVYKDVALQIAHSRVGSVPADRHHLGIATQRTSRKISGAYQDVLKWARSAATAAEFFDRMAAKGTANQDMRNFVATTRAHLIAGGVANSHHRVRFRSKRTRGTHLWLGARATGTRGRRNESCGSAVEPASRSFGQDRDDWRRDQWASAQGQPCRGRFPPRR